MIVQSNVHTATVTYPGDMAFTVETLQTMLAEYEDPGKKIIESIILKKDDNHTQVVITISSTSTT